MRVASGRGCRSWRLNLLSRRERRGRVAEGPVMLQSRGSAGLPHGGPPALPRGLPHGTVTRLTSLPPEAGVVLECFSS